MRKSLRTAVTIRKFNRFYLPYFHLLTQKYLNTEYSVTEARILYEIYEKDKISAKEIIRNLHVDKGYLSRILKKFEVESLIKREISDNDSRVTVISLTKSGKMLAEELIMESNQQIEKEIAGISDRDLDKLTHHLEAIVEILRGIESEDH